MTLQRREPLKRTRMKRSQPRCSWQAAIRKLEREGACRVCGCTTDVQAAHTVSRQLQDVEVEGPRGGRYLLVKEDAVVPLCGDFGNGCHGKYDRRELDLLPYLFLAEQINAVEAAGGIASAYRRLTGS